MLHREQLLSGEVEMAGFELEVVISDYKNILL